MQINRRDFLNLASSGITALTISGLTGACNSTTTHSTTKGIQAVAFDAFPIFDPRPIFGLVKKLYPSVGSQFASLWRTKIFGYTWLRVSGAQYRDFWGCIEDALIYTARDLKVELTDTNKTRLMNAFLQIKAWPDVKNALQQMKDRGIKLGFLSNMTEKMLHAGIRNSGLEGYFDHVISTDRAKTFKPDKRAYQLGVDAFALPKENIAFTAFAGWDAAGAKWFGYPTVWVNRLNFSAEELGGQPDRTGRDLSVLLNFLTENKSVK